MIRIGLSGNRYSGKDKISKIFETIRIPVFNADVILKYIINHEISVINDIKSTVGKHVFSYNILDPTLIKSQKEFDEIIDCAELELMLAYDKFNDKYKNSIYTIFHSSMLYERSWDKSLDYNITIHCPRVFRINRMKDSEGKKYKEIYEFFKNEIDDNTKNGMANYVIHNYTPYYKTPLQQVNEIDENIVNKYLVCK